MSLQEAIKRQDPAKLTRMGRARQVVAHLTDPNQAFVRGKSMAETILQRTFRIPSKKQVQSDFPGSLEVIHG
jgi:hypothetical protein